MERYYQSLSGERRSLQEIVQRRETDADAEATVERLLAYFGRAMASVINILDPHAVVLGGGVSNVELLYAAGLEEIARHIFNDRLETRIVKHQLGDSAGVFGAAMLVA